MTPGSGTGADHCLAWPGALAGFLRCCGWLGAWLACQGCGYRGGGHWTQALALTGAARRWEPKRLRLLLLAVAGRLVRGGRRLRLRLAERWPWVGEITAAITRLQALPSG